MELYSAFLALILLPGFAIVGVASAQFDIPGPPDGVAFRGRVVALPSTGMTSTLAFGLPNDTPVPSLSVTNYSLVTNRI